LEKPKGGFSFAPTAPPCLKDTYYATLTFRILGENGLPSPATKEWVRNEPFHPEAPLSTLSCHVKLCRLLEIPPQASPLRERIKEELGKYPAPRRLAHLRSIVELIGSREEIDAFKGLTQRIDPHPTSRDTSETLFYKATLTRNQGDRWKAEIAEWLKCCRNGDGGYGCRPNTTSFLEHLYWATRLMELAGITITEEEKRESVQFVLCSRSKRGGFGRAPEGVPFIDSSYHAIWILRFFNDI